MSSDWLPSFLQWVSGESGAASNFMLARWIFLRALGIVYLIAFISIWIQIKGLIGTNGILPVQEFLGAIKNSYGAERFALAPTVFWLSASDAALHIVCALGVVGSIALIAGFMPTISSVLLWVMYLSIVTVGSDFMSFQWDVLLLEVGFLAIFLSAKALSPLVLFLLWFLLFRFMFESGVVKLNSGDTSWLDFTALKYHYLTQPLPHWVAWYMDKLPLSFQKLSVLFTYMIELILPFLMLGGRWYRLSAATGIAALNLIIMATGNYNFFNLLTIALCILLIDDGTWTSILPDAALQFIGHPLASNLALPQWHAWLVAIVGLLIVLIGMNQLIRTMSGKNLPLLTRLEVQTQPFHLVNGYGLFRVMTKDRPEIIVQGSNDGKSWESYEFKYKPGDLSQRPQWIQPHQPRLDWQMWFAALSNFDRTYWFQRFMVRLLEGSDDVLALIKTNPFPDRPPKHVRALYYDYEYTSFAERKDGGNWWKRTSRGLYAPQLSLQE